jgi:hypothetical protein
VGWSRLELTEVQGQVADKRVAEVDKHKLEAPGFDKAVTHKPATAKVAEESDKVFAVVGDNKVETDRSEWIGVLEADTAEAGDIETPPPAEIRAQDASQCYRKNTIGRF